MIDYIALWTGMTTAQRNAWKAAQPPLPAVMTVPLYRAYYLARYWRECVDVEFEREFACFWPEWEVAA